MFKINQVDKDKQSIADSQKSGVSTYMESSQGSSEKTSNPVQSDESFKAFSIFGDSACGEPLKPQQLVIDFTPIEEVDTDYVQMKCNAFWEFISSQPEFQGLMAEPDLNLETNVSETSDTARAPVHKKEKGAKTIAPKMDHQSALSTLELIDKKGLIGRAFEPKVPQSHCTLGSSECRENEPVAAKKPSCVCRNGARCKFCRKKMQNDITTKTSSVPEVKDMRHRMHEWDKDHPKIHQFKFSKSSKSPQEKIYRFGRFKMIQLPKLERHPEETAKICTCRPICKSRRREWKGKIQNTSAELLFERKPSAECFRRWPIKVFPNSPCPLFAKSHRVTINERNAIRKPNVVRICQAPIDDTTDTPYLEFAQLAKDIGAWNLVKSCCAFCQCCSCCQCSTEYLLHDAERSANRRSDMREFDARVKKDCIKMRIMYDKP